MKNIMIFLIFTSVFLTGIAQACTGIRLVANDGSPIFGRTEEFGDDVFEVNWKIFPRDYTFQGYTPDGSNGKQWKSKYGFVAATPFEVEQAVEGLNEHGLQVGVFYFQPYEQAIYQKYIPSKAKNSIGGWQLPTYIISQAKNVDEVRWLLSKVNVVDAIPYPYYKDWNVSPKIHLAVNDAQGNSVVIEYLNGELHIFDNPLGAITNKPRFDWHQQNLKQFTNLPIDQPVPFQNKSKEVMRTGLDIDRLESISGEITSESRFIRAAMYSQTAEPFDTALEGVHAAFNILNNFDIPKGFKRYRHSDGKEYSMYSQWTTVSDLRNKKMYIRSFYSPSVKLIDLNEINFKDGKVKTFEIPMSFEFDKIKINSN
ncbi:MULTISPECIES: linear amide C-N hydrolase [Aliivibrio]|uniref:linear amide C-N hydrolase n=1 Tax=Aliivibrio TaxID=511678 RepID=UPI0002E76E43|nr:MULTISPECIES: linear amide C-N hydrolase [Aliivibrio]MBD1569324.1 linear amide C-N hydrolase [Aliivibrio sp. S10_S31]MUH95977.1 linear amide C-N hydrolase [Aliivibrio fischeri]MUI62744.1 linear amide C-N hydrolase [Aliivibrio fischeri]OCH05954.1 choloylglycine hydrolase [Aliivibrio fischeri]OCH07621.1 choloylglycine hydrolase [Aliivibrio fischeri]